MNVGVQVSIDMNVTCSMMYPIYSRRRDGIFNNETAEDQKLSPFLPAEVTAGEVL
jgi:hypothetical protein